MVEKIVTKPPENEVLRARMDFDLMAPPEQADKEIVARVVVGVEVGELEAEAHGVG
jgi:hypothetical protein